MNEKTAKKLSHFSCLVRIRGPDIHDKRATGWPFHETNDGYTALSASGTVVDQDRRLILTAGSLIAPFRKYKQGTIIEVMFDESDEWVTCTLVDMRDIRVINESADRLLGSGGMDFRIGWAVDGPAAALNAGTVALLQCSVAVPPAVKFRSCVDVKRGDALTVVGSPFGLLSRAVFQNTLSAGVVSNIVLDMNGQPALLLTDARCLAGSEGGVVLDRNGLGLGIVGPPLHWPNGSFVELHLVLASDALTVFLKSVSTDTSSSCEKDEDTTPERVIRATQSLVRVSLPREKKWGSGIVLRNGSPVDTFSASDPLPRLKSASLILVTAESSQTRSQYAAELVYVSPPPLDAALLHVRDPSFHAVPANNARVDMSAGMRVFVAGYPVFGAATGLGATITAGVLAKITTARKMPVMLQSTAAVNQGNSGGMLLNATGQLLGMVTFNAIRDSKQTIPRLNFSLPLNLLDPLFAFAESNGIDRKLLEKATLHDGFIRRIMSLRTEPPLTAPNKIAKQPSKFSEFMQRMKSGELPEVNGTGRKLPHARTGRAPAPRTSVPGLVFPPQPARSRL